MTVSRLFELWMLAVGFRHSTWVSRPAGAASRFVGLHTPPSTYSRPPIVTGANSQGTVHEAATASGTPARGDPGLPNTTRRPFRRSTAVTRRRPSKRGPSRSMLRRRSARVWLGRGRRRRSRPRATAPPGAASPSASGANVAAAASAQAPARRAAASPAAASPSARPRAGRGRDLLVGVERGRAARRLTGGEVRRHDRARRGPDDSSRTRAGQSRSRPRYRPARPSSRPRRERRRRPAPARQVAIAS